MARPWPGLASPCSEAESARRVMTHFGVGYFPPSPPLPGWGEPGTPLHCSGPGEGWPLGAAFCRGQPVWVTRGSYRPPGLRPRRAPGVCLFPSKCGKTSHVLPGRLPMPPTAATSHSPLDLSLLLGCDRSGKPMTHDSAAAPPPVVPSSSPLPGVIWSVQTGLHWQEGLLSALTWAWRPKTRGARGGHPGPQTFSRMLVNEGSSYTRTVHF